MNQNLILILALFCFSACSSSRFIPQGIVIEPIIEDEISIRAIVNDVTMKAYAGSNGKYGFIKGENMIQQFQLRDSIDKTLEFRGLEVKNNKLFMVSAGSPARIHKINTTTKKTKLVYENNREDVFLDAMKFWNKDEGIVFGDAMDGCMTVLITRDAGENWNRVDCSQFPAAKENEGAFAASNTNIEMYRNTVWLASGTRVFKSTDKGLTWQVFDTPIIQNEATQGIYSIDFYDENNGIAIGGDYTKPDDNTANLMKTTDGGETWQVISSETSPGYRSCIQYIPATEGKGIVAVGFKGINLSLDSGKTWKKVSDESFYTIRFTDAKTGILAGKDRLSKFRLFE